MDSSETSGDGSDSTATKRRRGRPPKSETEPTSQETVANQLPASNPNGLLPDETPPAPATVSLAEAEQADREKDKARETQSQARKESPLKGRPSPLKGRKLGPRKKDDATGANVVVVSHKPTIYVDEQGNRLPDLGPDFAKPIIQMGSRMVEGMGMRPFDAKETDDLANSWAPIFHKYAGFIMPYMPEIMAGSVLLAVMWPRVKELDEKKKKERALVNQRAAHEAEAKKRAGLQTGQSVQTQPQQAPTLKVHEGGAPLK